MKLFFTFFIVLFFTMPMFLFAAEGKVTKTETPAAAAVDGDGSEKSDAQKFEDKMSAALDIKTD